MKLVRRLTTLLVIAAAVGLSPAGAAGACPSGAAAQGCCCGPDSCGCPPQPTVELAAPSCGCGPSAPAVPQPAGPSLSGPGTELAAVNARMPAALVAPAPPPPYRDGPRLGRTPAGPLIYLSECALLI